jgi:4-hydroxy-tetrahydrodipicolinate reductase
MGRCLVRAATESRQLTVAGAVAWAGSGSIGADAGVLAGVGPLGVLVTADLPAALAASDVAIDFSRSEATHENITACRAAKKPLLLGTTGWPAELAAPLAAAAREIPLLVAPNTSLGVALLAELTRIAARALPGSFDIEILESHHRAKRDAPSGTALALARAASQGRAVPEAEAWDPDQRSRRGPRRHGEIGFAVVRGGDIVGEHTVLFAGDGEQVSLTHRATDRMIFARGAVSAAVWLAGRPAGAYAMRDLLAKQ